MTDKRNVKLLQLQRPGNEICLEKNIQHRERVPQWKRHRKYQHTEDAPTRLSLAEAEPSSPSLNCSSLLELS